MSLQPESRHLTSLPLPTGTFTDPVGLRNMHQLIQLRWIAVVGQIATIVVASKALDIALPVQQMWLVLALLVAFNLASMLHFRRRRVKDAELLFALLVDVAALTALLALSGGATNPFASLYLMQVILAAILLAHWATWTVLTVTILCFIGLALFAPPLNLQPNHHLGLLSPYIQATLICFVLTGVLLVTFIGRISRNLRTRDARLASMRQRAVEEEHIVRMGLLASGAAHELGTPLSTMAVILGDWRHMHPFDTDADLRQEVDEMQRQVLRCKAIVSGILLSAGEARGESSQRTTLNTFLNELVEEWKRTRTIDVFRYENHLLVDLPVVSDSALKQMICNVLDNALEASPRWQKLEARRTDDTLEISVSDAGPGFPKPLLQQFGKPYQSSKGRAGGGLGLFLVVNVARTLGGTVSAANRPEGGAIVTVRLPLAAIVLEEEDVRTP